MVPFSLYLSFVRPFFHWARGAGARGRTTRRGKIAPDGRSFSPLLKVLPSRVSFASRNYAVLHNKTCAPSFLILSSLSFAPLSLTVYWAHYFGEKKPNRSRDQRRVLRNMGESRRRDRRDMEAGTARPEGIGGWHCRPGRGCEGKT